MLLLDGIYMGGPLSIVVPMIYCRGGSAVSVPIVRLHVPFSLLIRLVNHRLGLI